MTYRDTILTLNRLRELSAHGDDSVFSAAQKRWITQTYRAEMGEQLRECGCKNKYCDAVVELSVTLLRRGQLYSEHRYMLRHGFLIWMGTECYSAANITDDIARTWLEKHPEGAHMFERLPAE